MMTYTFGHSAFDNRIQTYESAAQYEQHIRGVNGIRVNLGSR